MQTRNIPIGSIVTNDGQVPGLPRNPRFIRNEMYEKLKRSIEDAPEMLSMRSLIVVPHGGQFVTICGNMRLRACMELGYKELPCYVLPEDTPAGKLREYTIKDNIGYGQTDWSLIANEWDTTELDGWGMEIEEWEDASPDNQQGDAEDDDFSAEEAENAPSRCKTGDVWILGEHRLMCGDSTDAGQVGRLMGMDVADLVITDPPYNVDYTGKSTLLEDAHKKISNDKMGDDSFHKFLLSAFTSLFDHMRPGAAIYVFHADTSGHIFRQAFVDSGLKLAQCLIWVKNAFIFGRQDYHWRHEPILYGWKEGAAHFFVDDHTQDTIIQEKKPNRSAEHPTMKPLPLIGRLMKNSSKRGGLVLDLFGGSGSTLIAAEQLGRRCRMMELDPHFCDVIMARWEKATGREARREEAA